MARHARGPSEPGSKVAAPEIRTGPVLRGAGGIAATLVLGIGVVGVSAGLLGVSVGVGHASDSAGAGGVAKALIATAAQGADAAIPDVPWLVERGDGRWIYGRGSATTPRVLPAGESGLAINDAFVATTAPSATGRSTVLVRSRETGGRVAEVEVPIWPSAGSWTESGLVLTGYPDSSMGSDGGLVLLALPDFSPRVLVDPRPFSRKLGTPVARGDVVVSPSGRFVGSNVCGLHLCDTEVVELATGQVFRPVQAAEGFLRVITDELAVTTDDDYAWISARRFQDGREAWRTRDSVLLDPIAAADGSVVGVVGSHRAGWGVASFDPQGRGRDLTPRVARAESWPRIWRDLSTSTIAIVGRESFPEAVGMGRSRAVDIIGLTPASAGQRTATFALPAESEWIDR